VVVRKQPRKRRTQTLADKGIGGPALYAWQTMLDSYIFHPSDDCDVLLTERGGSWHMNVTINKQKWHGERATLEEAFKATANLLYMHAKDFWLKMDTRAVTAPWAHELAHLEG
jgi:hypothetical protein